MNFGIIKAFDLLWVITPAFVGSLLCHANCFAQTKQPIFIHAGYIAIMPQVDSDQIKPSHLPDSKVDLSRSDSLLLGMGYQFNAHWSAELLAGLPHHVDILGDGRISRLGKLGTTKVMPPTVLLQYHFQEVSTALRPYIGAGITYAYFTDEQGSTNLDRLSNQQNTRFSIKPAWGLSAQLGLNYAITPEWFANVGLIKTWISTRANLSTEQSVDVRLDPYAFYASLGYRF